MDEYKWLENEEKGNVRFKKDHDRLSFKYNNFKRWILK